MRCRSVREAQGDSVFLPTPTPANTATITATRTTTFSAPALASDGEKLKDTW